MNALRTIAVASLLLLGFGAAANAQTGRQDYWAHYDQPTLATGRSVYVDRAPTSDAQADQIVMGLRVPNGPRYR